MERFWKPRATRRPQMDTLCPQSMLAQATGAGRHKETVQ